MSSCNKRNCCCRRCSTVLQTPCRSLQAFFSSKPAQYARKNFLLWRGPRWHQTGFFLPGVFPKVSVPFFRGGGGHARAGGAPRITKHLLPAEHCPGANHAALDVRVISADENRGDVSGSHRCPYPA